MRPTRHLSPEDIFGYEHQLLLPEDLRELQAHVAVCPECRTELAGRMGTETMIDSVHASLSSNVRMTPYWRYGVAAAAVLALSAGIWLTRRNAATAEPPSVSAALRAGRIEVPGFLQELRPTHQVLMGAEAPATVQLLSPVAVAVAKPRVTFRWQGAETDWAYQVHVFDARGEPLLSSPETRETEWSSDRDLTPGATYQWQLTAIRGAERVTLPPPSETPPKFRVVDAVTAARLRDLRQTRPNEHLLLGVEYGQAGLIGDARREINEALRLNPARTEIRTLLENLPDR